MAGMTGEHWSTAWLCHVADQEPGPADSACILCELFKIGHEAWMAPIAIARQAHDLPSGAICRKCNTTREATSRI
jgi:hypothetical protein